MIATMPTKAPAANQPDFFQATKTPAARSMLRGITSSPCGSGGAGAGLLLHRIERTTGAVRLQWNEPRTKVRSCSRTSGPDGVRTLRRRSNAAEVDGDQDGPEPHRQRDDRVQVLV